MRRLPNTIALSLAVLTGAASAALAQGMASLPPAGAQPAAVAPPAFAAPQAAHPNPGGGTSIPSTEAFRKPADWNSNRAYHPYTTSGTGPNPGTNVTANNEPNPVPPAAKMISPYSTTGHGPNPGANVTVPAPAR
jgi:hypothetical protein